MKIPNSLVLDLTIGTQELFTLSPAFQALSSYERMNLIIQLSALLLAAQFSPDQVHRLSIKSFLNNVFGEKTLFNSLIQAEYERIIQALRAQGKFQ